MCLVRLQTVLWLSFHTAVLVWAVSAFTAKWTNIECETKDRSFANFTKCQLKAVRRDYAELSLCLEIFKVPVHSIKARIQLWKRTNGYKPFLYDVEFDVCKLLGANNNKLSVEKHFFEILKPYSNANRTCPWSDRFFRIENMPLLDKAIALPMPSGSYRVDCSYWVQRSMKAQHKFYFTIVE